MNSAEAMKTVYDIMAGKAVLPKSEEAWEKLDTDCAEALFEGTEEINVLKEKLSKLENFNIFDNNFKVFENLPKTWRVIYIVLNEFYTINPRIVEYNETNSR